MVAPTIGTEARRLTGWSIAISLLIILAGILAIGLPVLAGIAVNLVVAWLLLFCGAAHLAFGWRLRGAGGAIWQFLMGALYIVIGVYLLIHPVAGLVTLTLALAIYLFIEGVLELILAFQTQTGRGWLLLDGIVSLILAIMIWRTWPSSTEWVLGTLVGISMIFSGASRLMLSLAARNVATKLA
ncbi:MAG: DUF308 domain-containing protein [Candidatus Acidiferrales bacterium]